MFHPQKFLMTSFLSLILNFEFPPPFSLKHYIFPSFGKFIISPYFEKFPSDFVKCTCFFAYFTRFSFCLLLPLCIYSSYTARTGRPAAPYGASLSLLEREEGQQQSFPVHTYTHIPTHTHTHTAKTALVLGPNRSRRSAKVKEREMVLMCHCQTYKPQER